MAARQETHEDFGAALDRITARLAHPLAALDIPVDLGIGEPLEGDDGIGDPHARAPVGAHDANPRQDMMPPPRQQAERSEERRVGKEGVRTVKYRWLPINSKKNKQAIIKNDTNQ